MYAYLNMQGLVDKFHFAYYHKQYWENCTFMGFPVMQSPMDLWVYQELIYRLKPQCIIQTGIAFGGSLLYFVSFRQYVPNMEEMIVIGIDNYLTDDAKKLLGTDNLYLIEGDSVDKDTVAKVNELSKGKPALVILDSDHKRSHVSRELELYSQMVPVEGYLVVEDTNINGHPVFPGFGPGPYEAVEEFLANRVDFVPDKQLWQKNLFSFHTWLKRIA